MIGPKRAASVACLRSLIIRRTKASSSSNYSGPGPFISRLRRRALNPTASTIPPLSPGKASALPQSVLRADSALVPAQASGYWTHARGPAPRGALGSLGFFRNIPGALSRAERAPCERGRSRAGSAGIQRDSANSTATPTRSSGVSPLSERAGHVGQRPPQRPSGCCFAQPRPDWAAERLSGRDSAKLLPLSSAAGG